MPARWQTLTDQAPPRRCWRPTDEYRHLEQLALELPRRIPEEQLPLPGLAPDETPWVWDIGGQEYHAAPVQQEGGGGREWSSGQFHEFQDGVFDREA